MIGYKGLDKDFKCRGFQFKVGETYHLDGEIKICERGFHFCDTPLATFQYYQPNESRYALVEAVGQIVSDKDDVHKFCTDELKILKEFTLAEFIQEADRLNDDSAATNTGNCSVATNTGDFSAATNTGDCSAATNTGNCSAATNTGNCSVATNTGDFSAATNTGDCSAATNTGNCSAATNTGNCSVATNTGNRSAATNTGYCSAASVAGKNSIAFVSGKQSKAKGAIGCWLVLTEWDFNDIAEVRAVKVDGEHVKPDTFYTLLDGKVIEVDDKN